MKRKVVNKMLQAMYKPGKKDPDKPTPLTKTLEELDKAIEKKLSVFGKKKKSGNKADKDKSGEEDTDK